MEDKQQIQSTEIPIPQKEGYKLSISKRKIGIIGGAILLVVLLIIGFFMFSKKSDSDSITTVGKEVVYTNYLAMEKEFYPGKKTAQIEKNLENKIIDDAVILEAGKKAGYVDSYPSGANLSKDEYLQRTKKIKEIEQKVTDKQDGIKGEVVSVWFYNNGFIGKMGYDAAKKIALAKITNLYEKVKKKQITVREAGQLIAADTSLAAIDPVYGPNSYFKFATGSRKDITFWGKFNDMLWNLKPGEITEIYLGDSADENGKSRDGVYLFGTVKERIGTAGYSSFSQWLEKQKKDMGVKQARVNFTPIESVYADDDENHDSDPAMGSVLGHCGHGCPPWEGHVVTETGAIISGATVTQKDCQERGVAWGGGNAAHCDRDGVASRNTTSDASGKFLFIDARPFDCGHNSHSFEASVSNFACTPQKKLEIGNVEYMQEVPNIVCTTITPPTPTIPPPACGATCTTSTECSRNTTSGCTICAPVSTGGNTCQPAPTPTPPACGSSCSTDAQCQFAADSCTVCRGGVCKNPNACGTACTTKADCDGARDNCSECLLNDAGTASACKPLPACGVPCVRDDQCAGALNGCTSCVDNDTGTAKSCKPVPACGTSCTKDSQCSKAANGCTSCTAGKCSAFSANMCSCDGMEFTGPNGNKTFFPGDNVTFIAYSKVPGKDWKGGAVAAINAAQVTSMSFTLYKSSLTNPNQSEIIATSADIPVQVVQSDAEKVRYKVTWDKQIPTTVPAGTLYRIQAKLTCSRKSGVLGAKTTVVGQGNYFSQLFDVVSSLFASGSVLGESTRQDQHADSFFPGATIQEKSCEVIKFFFE